MATKAELANEADQYQHFLALAKSAIEQNEIAQAVVLAVSSLPFVDGMMQFERKYNEREFKTVGTIEIILEYAPILFDMQSLTRLGDLLAQRKRIDKYVEADLGLKLAAAQHRLWMAHRLWTCLEHTRAVLYDALLEDLGGNSEQLKAILQSWESSGLVRRAQQENQCVLSLATNMDDPCPAKCPACGIVGRAPKAKLLEQVSCPNCKTRVHFVLLSSNEYADA